MGWVNIDLKQSQNGKYYAEQNTWKPSNDAPVAAKNNSEADDDDLPF